MKNRLIFQYVFKKKFFPSWLEKVYKYQCFVTEKQLKFLRK
jgi:hypothetical protein